METLVKYNGLCFNKDTEKKSYNMFTGHIKKNSQSSISVVHVLNLSLRLVEDDVAVCCCCLSVGLCLFGRWLPQTSRQLRSFYVIYLDIEDKPNLLLQS